METFSVLPVLCGEKPPVTRGVPSQRASNAEIVSMALRHHDGYSFILIWIINIISLVHCMWTALFQMRTKCCDMFYFVTFLDIRLIMTQASITRIRPLQWRHDGRDGVSNRQPHDCLLNRLFRRRSKKTSKLRVTALCGIHRWPVNSPHQWPVTRNMFPFENVINDTLYVKRFHKKTLWLLYSWCLFKFNIFCCLFSCNSQCCRHCNFGYI